MPTAYTLAAQTEAPEAETSPAQEVESAEESEPPEESSEPAEEAEPATESEPAPAESKDPESKPAAPAKEESDKQETDSKDSTPEKSEAEKPDDQPKKQEQSPAPEEQASKETKQDPAETKAESTEPAPKEAAPTSVEPEPTMEIEPEQPTEKKPEPPKKNQKEKCIIGSTATLLEKQSGLKFKARIDTGAKSCSLHVEKIEIQDQSTKEDIAERMTENIGKVITFVVKNGDGKTHILKRKIASYVIIKTSDKAEGKRRYKVPLTFLWKNMEKEVLVTLNNRKHMEYPLLIGRNFLRGDFLVDVEMNSDD